MLTRTKEEFYAAGHDIIKEFSCEGEEYVFYKQNYYDPIIYITSSRFGWQFGLTYSKKEQIVIDPYYLNPLERQAIERNYP